MGCQEFARLLQKTKVFLLATDRATAIGEPRLGLLHIFDVNRKTKQSYYGQVLGRV